METIQKEIPSEKNFTSVFKESQKTLLNLDSDEINKNDIDQYLNPEFYKKTNTYRKEEVSSLVSNINKQLDKPQELDIYSSYSNPYFNLKGRFETIQQWEGHIEQLNDLDKTFRARLIDLNENGTDEYSDFSYDEIFEDDYDLMIEGAIFYFTIGKATLNSGQVKKDSFIKFKRLPRVTKSDIKNINKQANDIFNRFQSRMNK